MSDGADGLTISRWGGSQMWWKLSARPGLMPPSG